MWLTQISAARDFKRCVHLLLTLLDTTNLLVFLAGVK